MNEVLLLEHSLFHPSCPRDETVDTDISYKIIRSYMFGMYSLSEHLAGIQS